VRRGCTVSNSFARGQGASALQQGRFRYVASREEMMAHGFAELWGTVGQHTAADDRAQGPGDGDGSREGGRLLLHDPELLHQDGSKLLDQVGSVARALEAEDNGLDDLVVDAAQLELADQRRIRRVEAEGPAAGRR